MLFQLRLMHLRSSLEVAARTDLPAYKANMLRRALLWQLGAIWRRQPERCRPCGWASEWVWARGWCGDVGSMSSAKQLAGQLVR